MCSVSAVMDYGFNNPPWQQPFMPQQPFPTNPPTQQPLVLPDVEARDAIKRFMELVDAAKRFDAATGQPHCEDPKKAEFMDEVLARLEAIEKRLGIK